MHFIKLSSRVKQNMVMTGNSCPRLVNFQDSFCVYLFSTYNNDKPKVASIHVLLKTAATTTVVHLQGQTDNLPLRALLKKHTPMIKFLIYWFSCFTCLVFNYSFNDTICYLFKNYCAHTTLQCFWVANVYLTIYKKTVYFKKKLKTIWFCCIV